MENVIPADDNIASKSSIQAIDKKTVHQICSGQVVLDLATAVKELVENSIDAGATNIEIRLREYGKDLIEVSDNGHGIEECDFEALALKHYTSKLREFTDLPSVNTFGFRGEALSSLCALGDLTVTTQNENAQVGFKLTFDHNGKLVERNLTARQRGTTVCIANLFYTLPVRHKEFHRNFKKDFSRLMNILYAFCLVNGTVRISCVNHVAKKKNILLSTNGKNLTLDIISSIFGVNQTKNLVTIEQIEPTKTILEEYNLTTAVSSDYANLFVIEGYVSSVAHGSGRSTADRQFFFINKRPCDFPKLSRVINDVYHSFNRHQYPFVFLNVSLNKDYVDVNVTPDKRKIMIHQENVLLVVVKSSLKYMFEHNCTFYAERNPQVKSGIDMTSPNTLLLSSESFQTANESSSIDNGVGCMLSRACRSNTIQTSSKTHQTRTTASMLSTKINTLTTSQNTLTNPFDRFRCKYEKQSLGNNANSIKQNTSNQLNFLLKQPDQSTLMSFFTMDSKKRKVDNDDIDVDIGSKAKKVPVDIAENLIEEYDDSLFLTKNTTGHISVDESFLHDDFIGDLPGDNEPIKEKENCLKDEIMGEPSFSENVDMTDCTTDGILNQVSNEDDVLDDKTTNDVLDEARKENEVVDDIADAFIVDEIPQDMSLRENVVVQFNFEKLKDNVTAFIDKKRTCNQHNDTDITSFRAKISVSENQSAEGELGKNVTKEMFHQMEILGQFNLGFIVVKLKHDLFIVDQHASDEKYNYESLQQMKCLKGQRLIKPLPMILTMVNESVLIDNLEIFKKNGFEFDIKEQTYDMKLTNQVEQTNDLEITNDTEKTNHLEIQTDRHEDVNQFLRGDNIKLLTVPTSRNWTFSVEDVEELIVLLGDSPGVMCRPSRVYKMFASRACRKSVMVGTALNKQKMKKMISHMAEIDHPWNCPHGRPTMRHLINLQRIASK